MLFLFLSTLISVLQFCDVAHAKSLKRVYYFELGKTICISLAFLFLQWSFAVSAFDFKIVAQNSAIDLPFLYKIFAFLSSHEGSMLLWVLLMQVFMITLLLYRLFDEDFIVLAAYLNNVILMLLLSYLVFISNPFESSGGMFGFGLNPILQSEFLFFHPAKFYIGYVGTSMLFVICLTILISKSQLDIIDFAKLHFVILLVWIFLTIGTALGCAWAYRELGWGGFWSWDPVENIALLPWLLVTAMLHCNLPAKKGNRFFMRLVIWLGIASFIIVLFGTTIVRAGALDSVHSFASNYLGGLYLAMISIFCFVCAGVIYRRRVGKLFGPWVTELNQRDWLMLGGVGILIVLAVALVCSLVVPLIYALVGHYILFDMSYYNILAQVTVIPLLYLTKVRGFNVAIENRSKVALWIIRVILFGLLGYAGYTFIFEFNILLLGNCVIALMAIDVIALGLVETAMRGSKPSSLSHIGFAVMVIGAVFAAGFQREVDTVLSYNKPKLVFDNFSLKLNKFSYYKEANYIVRQGIISVMKNDHEIANLKPSIRYHKLQDSFVVKSDYKTINFSDIYLFMGSVNGFGSKDNNIRIEVKVFIKPLIGLFWLGCAMMFCGGIYGALRWIVKSKGLIFNPNR